MAHTQTKLATTSLAIATGLLCLQIAVPLPHGTIAKALLVTAIICAFSLHGYSLQHLFAAKPSTGKPALFMLGGAATWILGGFLGSISFIAGLVGVGAMTAGAVFQFKSVKASLPKASVVDVAADPLTKGDDACLKHVKIGHILLLVGSALLLLGQIPALSPYLYKAGFHGIAIGYLLPSMYGLGHLWIPRWNGIPAIAAGAIKGELHTTLLGFVGVVAAFIVMPLHAGTGIGLMVGLGPFVFLGMFVYMGVLGANIMKNKSKTHAVTPEFVHVPWTFAGVFWLIAAILLGIFINGLPDQLIHQQPSIRLIHLIAGLHGGVAMLWVTWSMRIVAGDKPTFFHNQRTAFLAWNIGLLVLIVGLLNGSQVTSLAGAILTLIGVLLMAVQSDKLMRGTP